MSGQQPTIIYTLTDEAPLLATYAFLPIIRAFTAPAGIDVDDQRHLGGGPHPGRVPRVPDRRAAGARQPGRTRPADAAARHQHHQAAQHQRLGAAVGGRDQGTARQGLQDPRLPREIRRPTRKKASARATPSASAARSTRCCAKATPTAAPRGGEGVRAQEPAPMGEWSQASRTHVSHMQHGDFYHGEKSMTLDQARDVKMELVTKSGKTIVLKPKVSLLDGEIIDSMFMSKKALLRVLRRARCEDAHKTGVMFSLHVKATMMKVSHPIVFGHAREDLLQGRLRQARQAVRRTGRQRQQRHGRSVRQDRHAAGVASATRSSATCTPATSTARNWRWSIRPRASPTCTRRTT